MSRTVLLLAVSLGMLLVPRIAAGCAIGPKQTVLEAYNDADVVVIARAVSVEKISDPSSLPMHGSRVVSTVMEVQKVFKGNLGVGSKMTFGQGNGIRCTWVFYEEDVGKEYLFYLQKTPEDPNLWYEFGYSRSDLISRVADDLLYLNNIEAVRGRTRVSGTLSEDEPGQKIWILGKDKVYETTTDKNGVYELYDLPPGRYVLEPELPFGWKIDRQTRGTSTVPDQKQIRGKHVSFTLKPRQHAAIDIAFVLDNVISGSVVDAGGKALPEVQVSLKPVDVNNESINFECTDEQGRFAIESITPGNYVVVVNEDGKKTIKEPFSAIYYPNVTEQARARIFHIRAGDNIKGLKIVVPDTGEMVTVQGVVRYADGTPARKVTVRFTPARVPGFEGAALADTNAQGEFSFKILKGLPGALHADFFAYSGRTAAIVHKYDYAKCPQVHAIVKQTGQEMIKTPALGIDAKEDLLNVVLTFPFRSCTKQLH